MNASPAAPPRPVDFAALYREHRSAVAEHLSRRVPAAEVDDLLQQVFAKAGRALPDFRGDSTLRTWLLRIATRSAVDHLRSRGHRETRCTDPLPDASVENHAGTPAVPATLCTPAVAPEQAVRTEMHACIHEHIDRLPEQYRTVLRWRDLDELPNTEIARRLGVGLEAAKIRVHRARRALRRLLEQGCDFYGSSERGLACDRRAPAKTVVRRSPGTRPAADSCTCE